MKKGNRVTGFPDNPHQSDWATPMPAVIQASRRVQFIYQALAGKHHEVKWSLMTLETTTCRGTTACRGVDRGWGNGRERS
nr:hypothetical protein [Gammaproteobacteria bacterium]